MGLEYGVWSMESVSAGLEVVNRETAGHRKKRRRYIGEFDIVGENRMTRTDNSAADDRMDRVVSI